MTAAATPPDAFKEVCLIGVIKEGGSEVQFAALTEDITGIEIGEKDIEGVPLVNGGRVVKFTPQGDSTITIKMVPVTAKVDGTGIVQHFYPQSSDDTTQPILVDASRTRKTHRLILTWAWPTLPLTAGATITANGTTIAKRLQVVNAYMTGYKPSFDDKMFSAEVTFKWAPFDKSGTANERWESCDGSEILPAAGTSTTSLSS